MKHSKLKMVRSGNRLEIVRYKEAISYGDPQLRVSSKLYSEEKSESEKIKIVVSSSRRARRVFTRLVHANIKQWLNTAGKITKPTFLTLTFKENIKNNREANKVFTKFIKRLNYEATGQKKSFLKYMTAIEFQQRGAVHYHILFFNLLYIHKKRLEKIWGQGFIKVKRIKDVDKMIEYSCKYMVKNFLDNALVGQKNYFCSRGLKKPVIARDEKRNEFFIETHEEELGRIEEFSKKYSSNYCGEFHFSIYNLGKNKKLKAELLAFEMLFGLQ